MLTFTRTIEIRTERVDLNELVREAFVFMEKVLAAQDIALNLDLADGLGEIEADPELLKQVMLNLAQNSIQAMNDGGTLSVETSRVAAEGGGEAAVVSIVDTGCGIEPQHLERIFDPFFSTRKGGTGLGLSVVSQIVVKHGGLIQVDSEPGRGGDRLQEGPFLLLQLG